jgi:hypothetical protein
VSGQHEDDAWRSIVENYGERALDEPEPVEETPEPAYVAPRASEPEDDPEDRFVPPLPPPLPHPPPVRMAAWCGLFGAPAVLLVALVLGIPLPQWLGLGLVGAFLVGFGYLVLHMQRGPRDPWDDGAQL